MKKCCNLTIAATEPNPTGYKIVTVKNSVLFFPFINKHPFGDGSAMTGSYWSSHTMGTNAVMLDDPPAFFRRTRFPGNTIAARTLTMRRINIGFHKSEKTRRDLNDDEIIIINERIL